MRYLEEFLTNDITADWMCLRADFYNISNSVIFIMTLFILMF